MPTDKPRSDPNSGFAPVHFSDPACAMPSQRLATDRGLSGRRYLPLLPALLLVGAGWSANAAVDVQRAVAGEPQPATASGLELGLLEIVPYASASYLRDSNLFRFSREVADVTGTTDTSDRIQRYLAGFDVSYSWQQQRLAATVEGRSLDYERFPHLDHSERLLKLDYAGGFSDHTTGNVTVSNERRMASFEDRRSRVLVIERDHIAEGGAEVAITPTWRILGGTRYRRLRSPLPRAPALPLSGVPARPASPDFELTETAFLAGVRYGIESAENPASEAPLLVGLEFEHQTVRFSGFVPEEEGAGSEDYRLLSLETTAQYVVSDLSRLDASLGATRFKSLETGASSSVELTGEVGYTRELSAITEISASVFRRFSPFVADADVTTDTGFGVGAKWAPLPTFALLLDYSWAKSEFGDQGDTAPENTDREDKTKSGSLSVEYSRFAPIGIRLYGQRYERDSSLDFNNFSDNAVGAEISFRWR